MPRGIKKVSEDILASQRALIITEKDKNNYVWGDIPDGSLFIDTTTGISQVKLAGETDWVPFSVKNDGTICISKDAYIKRETFTVVSLDNGDGSFLYSNSNEQLRHTPLQEDGGYLIELEDGEYTMNRNHLDVTINDTLHRSAASDGLKEISTKRFKIYGKLAEGQEITASYYQILRIGNPYPRIFESYDVPVDAEDGDLWLDANPAPYASKIVKV